MGALQVRYTLCLKMYFHSKKYFKSTTIPALSGFMVLEFIFDGYYENDKLFGRKDLVLDSVFYNDGK